LPFRLNISNGAGQTAQSWLLKPLTTAVTNGGVGPVHGDEHPDTLSSAGNLAADLRARETDAS
jgi:hypothetical protein